VTAKIYGDTPGGDFLQHCDSQADVSSQVVKASHGVFFEITGSNNSSSTRYIQIYNSATVPTDGAVPALPPITVPPYGVFSMSFAQGVRFDTGISWASSTTRATKSESGVGDVWAAVSFK